MRKTLLPALLLLATALPTSADTLSSLQKLYFSATKPGSWARYEQISTDQKGKTTAGEMTISRLENEGGLIWMEIRIDPKGDKKAKPMTLKYLLNKDFPVEKNALNFGRYIDRVIIQQDGEKAQEMPWAQVKAMMGGSLGYVDYDTSLVHKGTETVEGRRCDRYSLKGPFELKVMFITMKGTTEADLWLDDSVPFARVKESSVTKDDGGKVIAKVDTRLLDHGAGARSRVTGPVEKAPEMPDFSKAFRPAE